LISTANLVNLVSTSYFNTQMTSSILGLGTVGYVSTPFTGSTINLSTANVTTSSLTLIDTITRSTGLIYEASSLLYFNNFVIGGAFALFAQIYSA